MILRLENVHIYYGLVHMLQGVSVEIERGEVLALLGRNGAGKTTVLKSILGLVPPRAGKVVYRDEDITGLDDRQLLSVRRRIGMVFQNSALFDSLTVAYNLAYPLLERGLRDEAELMKRVRNALQMVDLPGTEDVMPAEADR